MKITVKSLLITFLSLGISGCSNQVDKQVNSLERGNPLPIISLNKGIKAASYERSPILISRNFGQSWEPIEAGLPKDIQVSFMELKGQEIVLASDNRGVYISKENRSQWHWIGEGLPNPKINALYVSGETIYIGVYKNGIYQSLDAGISWEALHYNLPDLNVQSIYRAEDHLLVGTDAGIFRLRKEEIKWEPTNTHAQVLSIYEFDNKMIAGSSQGTMISHNKGKSWEWIRKKGAVHYTRNIGRRIVELQLNGDLIYSDDWGESWKEMSYEPRKGSYVYEIVKIDNYEIISNNYGIHRSATDGQSWELIFPTESLVFFDFLVVGSDIYGGTRSWDEYRKRNE